MLSAKPIHLPLSVILHTNRKPALNRRRLLWQRLQYALGPLLFVALVAVGLARLAIADSPWAPANPVADIRIQQPSPIVGAVPAGPAPDDDADDSDSEPAPSKEVAELYKQIQDLRAKEMAQISTP